MTENETIDGIFNKSRITESNSAILSAKWHYSKLAMYCSWVIVYSINHKCRDVPGKGFADFINDEPSPVIAT